MPKIRALTRCHLQTALNKLAGFDSESREVCLRLSSVSECSWLTGMPIFPQLIEDLYCRTEDVMVSCLSATVSGVSASATDMLCCEQLVVHDRRRALPSSGADAGQAVHGPQPGQALHAAQPDWRQEATFFAK